MDTEAIAKTPWPCRANSAPTFRSLLVPDCCSTAAQVPFSTEMLHLGVLASDSARGSNLGVQIRQRAMGRGPPDFVELLISVVGTMEPENRKQERI